MGICAVCGQLTEFESSRYCKQCFMRYNPAHVTRDERMERGF